MTNLPTTAAHTLGDIIDLERYPITDRASSSYRALVAQSQSLLGEEGVAIFRVLSVSHRLSRMAQQTLALHSRMFRFRENHTVYFKPQDESVDPAASAAPLDDHGQRHRCLRRYSARPCDPVDL